MFDAVVIADLHWGAIDPERFQMELDKCLFDRLNHMKKLDAIFIAGDLFDMKEYSSSKTFRFVLSFLNKLILYTEKSGAKIVVLKGTRNHDDLQLYTLEDIYRSCPRIKFVHSVAEDCINGVSLLYIPEEYVIDQELYYREYFSKHYDIMIGHGMIDKIWYAKEAKRSNMSSAPVFDVEELCKVANYCYFGHIHEHKPYGKDKRFKYVGPVTVWEYDKKDHGYYIIHYNKNNELMREDYIENENAQVLRTIPIVVGDDTTMDTLMDKMDSILRLSDYDRAKIVARIKPISPIYMQAKNYLITTAGLHDNIILDIITDNDDSTVETTEEIAERELEDEFHEALSYNQVDDDTAIAEFIKNKEGKNISLDRIREVCGIPND